LRFLITGGAGFIGSHLAEHLLNRGDEVYIIDDLSTGSMENIKHFKDREKFHYTIDTIMNHAILAELIDYSDLIFHLAAAVGVRLIIESPVRTIETNIKGTELVLELAAKKKKKVVLASTSEIYGKSQQKTFKEEDDMIFGPTIKARWSYACSKAIDEFLAIAYCKEKKLPVVIVRLFNIVGPRQTGRYGMVIPTFIKQALGNKPITIYGNGKQTRTFTYIADAVQLLIDMALHPQAVCEVFNVGGTEEISIKDLAYRIRELADSNSEIVYIPYAEAYEEGFEDMLRRVPNVRKVRKLLGYYPNRSLDDILIQTIEYYKNKQ
jgi:UDP-glucose 4-epimerase